MAAIKFLVYFTSWQHGRMAATPKKPLQPPNNPFLRLRCHPATIRVEPSFICGYAAMRLRGYAATRLRCHAAMLPQSENFEIDSLFPGGLLNLPHKFHLYLILLEIIPVNFFLLQCKLKLSQNVKKVRTQKVMGDTKSTTC